MNISHGRDAHPEFSMLLDNIYSMEQPEKKKVRYKPESGASSASELVTELIQFHNPLYIQLTTTAS